MPWSFAERLSARHGPGLSRWFQDASGVVSSSRTVTSILVGLFTVAYFVAARDLASLRPFSFDELTTYNIARLPTAGDVWGGWFESYDGMPPVVHIATHLAGSALGFSQLTARLPAMLGFWLMCLCIFVFLSRRVCPMLALLGMLLPVTVPSAFAYAYDARGYGIVLGLSGAAVLCWDLTYDRRWRRVALLGLPITLAAAVATHFYAILVVFPLALGELARVMDRRRVDWWVWIGLVVPGLVLLPANPVLSRIRSLPELARYSVGPKVSMSYLAEVWSQFLSIPATYLGLLALICLRRDRAPQEAGPPSPTIWERLPSPADSALVLGFIALPAGGWLLANLFTGLFSFRYVVPAVIGFSLLIPLLCRVAVGRRSEIALLLAGWVALTAAENAVAIRYAIRTTTFTTAHIAAGRGCFRLLNLWERLPEDGLPIVVSDFFVFNQIYHYGPEALKDRMVFVVEPRFGQLIQPHARFFARVFGQRIEGLEAFLRANRSFYLYDCGDPARLPLVEMLLDAGASLRESGLVETPDVLLRSELYRVSMTDGSTESTSGR